MKVAVVHDWLTDAGGAECVLREILDIYKNADIFTLVNFIDLNHAEYLKKHKIYTSFIQKLPFSKSKYRQYLPLMPYAIEQFDLSEYDLVISSSYCVAKGVITGPDQRHICYCHSPVRYAWDLQHQYLKETNKDRGLTGLLARYFLHKIRIWDIRSSFGVDTFIANSKFIARRIEKTYRRKAEVVNPPVDVEEFNLIEDKQDYYLTCSRLVPYKRIDLIAKAFTFMPEKRLIIIGSGPDYEKIKKIATNNIELKGYLPFKDLKSFMEGAKAFIFAAEEDFGIVPVEAQACGTPVIAYGKGGCLETVVDGITGVHFSTQNEQAIIDAVKRFESLSFDPKAIRKHAETFSIQIFKEKFLNIVKNNVGRN